MGPISGHAEAPGPPGRSRGARHLLPHRGAGGPPPGAGARHRRRRSRDRQPHLAAPERVAAVAGGGGAGDRRGGADPGRHPRAAPASLPAALGDRQRSDPGDGAPARTADRPLVGSARGSPPAISVRPAPPRRGPAPRRRDRRPARRAGPTRGARAAAGNATRPPRRAGRAWVPSRPGGSAPRAVVPARLASSREPSSAVVRAEPPCVPGITENSWGDADARRTLTTSDSKRPETLEVLSMGRRIGAVAVTILLGASVAWAQGPAPSSSDSP